MADSPTIIDNGVLTTSAWPGKISAKTLVETRKTSEQTITDAIEQLNDFYVAAAPAAPIRCIDGRTDPLLDTAAIGLQLPGGTPGAAVSYRLAVGLGVDDSLVADAEALIVATRQQGLAPGGHRDTHNKDTAKIGCGAIDGMDAALQAMLNPDLSVDHHQLVSALLGDQFDDDIYGDLMGIAQKLDQQADTYFQNREQVIIDLEQADTRSVGVLEGDHQECLAVINLVPNTTFNTNLFAQMLDGTQAFG